MKIFEKLLQIKESRGAGYFVLIDPDKQDIEKAVQTAQYCEASGVDALLVGGSLLFTHCFDEVIKRIKDSCGLPIILFPGSTKQVSQYADALLYLSLISGRNADTLIGQQVLSAPIIKAVGIEPISTGYMFIESGSVTSALFISDTNPIPRDKPDIASAHALAAEYLGMKCVYLEAGSGAKLSVPDAVVQSVRQYCNLPVIVGGGIRKPKDARAKVEAGADFVVTGSIIERNRDADLIAEFAKAVHVNES
ncbi:MAG: geranylgeranylglyceryl/heptaprenylglyceryl phosphate synthase [candidate division KSB1 bacterium]|nr:geranylgeranylglyceryl/heptaprenylglyceryl phosphate synthase [candidate division KSB1 bacterium]